MRTGINLQAEIVSLEKAKRRYKKRLEEREAEILHLRNQIEMTDLLLIELKQRAALDNTK